MKRMFQKVLLRSLQGCSLFTIGGFRIFGIKKESDIFQQWFLSLAIAKDKDLTLFV